MGQRRFIDCFGHPLCSDDVALKILWIKNNEPDVYNRTFKFLTGSSFICAKLTGEFKIDRFLGTSSFIPLYNADGSINEEECSLFCRPDQLATCASVTDIAGYVTSRAAQETGLAEGTPVIVCTGDSTAEAISGGLVRTWKHVVSVWLILVFLLLYGSNGRGRQVACQRRFTVPNTYCIGGGTNAAGTLTSLGTR